MQQKHRAVSVRTSGRAARNETSFAHRLQHQARAAGELRARRLATDFTTHNKGGSPGPATGSTLADLEILPPRLPPPGRTMLHSRRLQPPNFSVHTYITSRASTMFFLC